ncbi:MAG: MFS transporter [Thermosynechococcaceae cyanobacterium]
MTAQNRNLWIIASIAFVNALSFTILIPILYLYGRQFGLNDFETSLLFSTFSLAQFFATPVIGKLSDRFGRKPLLVISLAGTVVANLWAGAATAAWMLFCARILDGITGGNGSVAQAVISDITDESNRARGFGLFGAAFGLGFVLGPVISLLAQQISLGAAFYASGAIAALALVMTVLFLPETLEHKVRTNIFDLGLDTLITGLFMPKVGILLIINLLIGTTFTMFTFAFQPYYLKVLGQNSQSLTILFIAYGTLGVIMQTVGVPFLTQRFKLTRIFFFALLIRSISFVLMPIWPMLAYFVTVTIVFSVLNSLVQPIINTMISLNAKAGQQGVVLGLNSSYLSISNAIGPVLAGLMVRQSSLNTYGYPLYVAGIFTFLVLLVAITTRQRYAPAS